MLRRSRLIRRTPLRRSTKPIPKRRVKPRRGPMRDRGYLDFLKHEGFCAVCWKGSPVCPGGDPINRNIDPAHGPANGTSQKGPDDGAIPLCRKHHDQQHALGWAAFEKLHGIIRAVLAAAWWKLYSALR